jgi:hypothetical protein
MSRHVSRKDRWKPENAQRYVSAVGTVVYREKGWFGMLDYRTRTEREGGPPTWEQHTLMLGPFKRSRNAMVAVEREAAFLKNRHGDRVLFGDQLWAET